MKPIYEIYLSGIVSMEAIKKVEANAKERLPEYHVVVLVDENAKSIRTKIIYPTATFWGWWYNLWNS